jgi:hypothetical protein
MPRVIRNDTAWVLVKSQGVVGEEWNRMISDIDYLCAKYVEDIGKGLLVFTDPEAARQYVKDGKLTGVEVIMVERFANSIAYFQQMLADLRCVILDLTFGDGDVKAKAVLVENIVPKRP